MRSLKNVVDALRREIASALEQGGPLPGGARLEAERVVVTLQFRVDEAAAFEAVRFSVRACYELVVSHGKRNA